MRRGWPFHLLAAAAALAAPAAATDTLDGLPSQSLPAPFRGQHVGIALADLNDDGAIDVLVAAGRHWVDQSYALINLGPEINEEGRLEGVKFSEALPVGPPGAYYQVDVSPSPPKASGDEHDEDEEAHRSTVLLVGGTCHVETPNEFGSCKKGENTPARVLHVSMSTDGCSVRNPDAKCELEYEEVWAHPDPKGDRNGGFARFGDREMIALLGQGGIELLESMGREEGEDFLHTGYSSVYQHTPPEATDPRSDFSRYAGFAAGKSPKLGGVVAAGRRSDYDAPTKDADGNVVGINKLFFHDGDEGTFGEVTLPASHCGEPYEGDPRYSLQSTNYAFADIDGDGIQDLLEATFLYAGQRVEGYPLPQRIHFLDEDGGVRDTLVVLEEGEMQWNGVEDEDAGRSVTTGQIFSDSALPDVVFASAEGVVTLFANLGRDESTGKFRGLEQRHSLRVGTQGCQVRDVAVAPLAREEASGGCWTAIVCAVTCGVDRPSSNHVFYVEGCGEDGGNNGEGLLEGGAGVGTSVS